jgi:hypothetical protein
VVAWGARVVSEATRLPGFWRFAWLFFMQPITLHGLLGRLNVDPEAPLWKLLRQRRSPAVKWWLVRCAQVLVLCTPAAALVAAGVLVAFGFPVTGYGLAFGVAGGVACGAIFSVPFGVGYGVVSGVTSGAAFGVSFGTPIVAIGLAFGVTFGLAVGVGVGVAFGDAPDVGFSINGGVALFTSLFRLPIFVLEMIFQSAARCWKAITGRSSLAWVPVLHHDLSYLPHPFLKGHLLAEADCNPNHTRRVLDACSIAPGQRRTGRKVEAQLRATELTRLARANDFQDIEQLRGTWLPGIQGADPLLLNFSEAARYLTAQRTAFNPHHRLKHLQGFENQLRAIENQLRNQRNAFTQPFEQPLEALRQVGRELRLEAEKDAEGLIPNPFRAGNPLSGEEGPELFRGREGAAKDIEDILADANRTASLLLLAPRRAGKTSLLKMLPRMLPDAVCVFFDLQAHPVTSVGSFWTKLAEQAAIQAKRDRRVELPAFPSGPPIEAAAVWLDKLDRLPGGRRVLIAIDEFEPSGIPTTNGPVPSDHSASDGRAPAGLRRSAVRGTRPRLGRSFHQRPADQAAVSRFADVGWAADPTGPRISDGHDSGGGRAGGLREDGRAAIPASDLRVAVGESA